MEIQKVNKSYFKLYRKPICSVIVSRKLLPKLTKLFYKHKNELEKLLLDNIDEVERQEWSLAYPNGKQQTFVAINTDNKRKKEELIKNALCFDIGHVEDLYDIGGADIYSKVISQKVASIMELEQEADNG